MTRPLALSAELEAFLRAEIAYAKRRVLVLTDRIEEDLKYTGDDAYELMQLFFQKFSVDAGDYEFNRHFEFYCFPTLFGGFVRRRLEKRGVKLYAPEDRIPVTVGMLQLAIELGRWDTEQLRMSVIER
ncbi:acyl carrier protein [Caballeronia temeraria]|uniref:Acyl carrier protein n=1 Tax=Caballeronia temeraria TaxID=1777137 RepID=A0A158CN83_9BURK|nr:DUF1493 family protein [Caballeronia temeraria]SAK83017.1 acyl carrier protein [Caballeronia temeraria]